MPVKYGRVALATGGGTQTVTTGIGEAAKGVIVWGVKATAAGFGAGYSMSIGAADAAASWHMAIGADDNVATSNTYGYGGTSDLGRLLTAEATYDCIFDIGAFESDGDFTIVFSDAPSSAWEFHYLVFYGADVSACKCVSVDNQAGSGNQTITGAGFTPTWVLAGMKSETAGSNATGRLSVGMAASSTERGFVSLVDADNVADASVGVGQRTDRLFGFASTSGTWARLADFVNFNSDGCVINWDAANTQRPCHFFFVDIDDVWVGSFSADTAGTTQNITGPGFQGGGFLALSRDQASASTIDNSSANAGKVSIFSGDGNDEGGIWFSEDDAAATMEANQRHTTGKGIGFYDWPSTVAGEADVLMTSSGVDIDWSTNPTRASEVLLTVFGAGVLTIIATAGLATFTSPAVSPRAVHTGVAGLATFTSPAVSPTARAAGLAGLATFTSPAVTPSAVHTGVAGLATFTMPAPVHAWIQAGIAALTTFTAPAPALAEIMAASSGLTTFTQPGIIHGDTVQATAGLVTFTQPQVTLSEIMAASTGVATFTMPEAVGMASAVASPGVVTWGQTIHEIVGGAGAAIVDAVLYMWRRRRRFE